MNELLTLRDPSRLSEVQALADALENLAYNPTAEEINLLKEVVYEMYPEEIA